MVRTALRVLLGLVVASSVLGAAAAAEAAPSLPTPTTATRVPCRPAALVRAVNRANARGSGLLLLAPGCRYVFTTAQAGTDDALPPIHGALTVQGRGATVARSRDQRTPAFRLLEVAGGGRLDLDRLSVRGGFTTGPEPDGGSGIEVREGGTLCARHLTLAYNAGAQGAGLNNFGHARLVDSLVKKNQGLLGSGVANAGLSGRLLLLHSLITDNQSESDAGVGGGLANSAGGTVRVLQSTVGTNTASNSGGGIRNDQGSTMYLVDSRVARNTAGPLSGAPTVSTGGGIQNIGTMELRETVVVANKALRMGEPTQAFGGGLSNLSPESGGATATLTLSRSVVTDNQATDGAGGIYNDKGAVSLTKTSVSANRPSNCTGSPTPVPGCTG